MPLLSVENLSISFRSHDCKTLAVDDLSFSVDKGEVLGIVGESGSGKSVSCYSLLGLVPCPPGKVECGKALFNGQDLLSLNEKSLRAIRGNKIAMIFQEPMTSLNPYMTIGQQLVEPLLLHNHLSKKEARQQAVAVLAKVGIVGCKQRIDEYPFQFSGGMRQRVMIAMALLNKPNLLIADEPTTALDVTVQAQILALIKSLQAEYGMAVIFISHDLSVVSQMADHVVVMENGKKVEEGPTQQVFNHPQHAYTQKLLSAIPTSAKIQSKQYHPSNPNLLEVKNLCVEFGRIKPVTDVSFSIKPGEILGLVGESGSGKSTLARSIMCLLEPKSGQVLLGGVDLLQLRGGALRVVRPSFQMIFQDTYASLNPRMTVFDTLAESIRVGERGEGKGGKCESILPMVYTLMDEVGLQRSSIQRYPHEFSGGQRQRIAIARALAMKPRLIVADEPVSALDVTIQAQILELLMGLTKKYKIGMLFITHDLAVVRYISDNVAVMRQGRLVEQGSTESLFSAPRHSYTQSLLKAIPMLKRNKGVKGSQNIQ